MAPKLSPVFTKANSAGVETMVTGNAFRGLGGHVLVNSGQPSERVTTEFVELGDHRMGKQMKFPLGSFLGMNVMVSAACFWFYQQGQPLFRVLAAAAVAYICLNTAFAITWRRLKRKSV